MANNHNSEVNAELLKAPLNAKASYKDKTTMSLVEPQNIEHADNLPISELIDKLKGNTSEIENPFGGKIDGAKVTLTMAYLRYLQTEGEATTPAENKDTSENTQGEATCGMEYTLELEVQDINSQPIFKKIEDVTPVNKITMAVWNTDDTEPSKKRR